MEEQSNISQPTEDTPPTDAPPQSPDEASQEERQTEERSQPKRSKRDWVKLLVPAGITAGATILAALCLKMPGPSPVQQSDEIPTEPTTAPERAPESPPRTTETSPEVEGSSAPVRGLGEITVLGHNLSPEEAGNLLKRSREGLRLLRPLESGKRLGLAPPGTFGFFVGHSFSRSNPQPSDDWYHHRVTLNGGLNNLVGSNPQFQVHRLPDKTFMLLAFTTESEAIRIGTPGASAGETMLTPFVWGEMTSMVSIPFNRVVTWKFRQVPAADGTSGLRIIVDTALR